MKTLILSISFFAIANNLFSQEVIYPVCLPKENVLTIAHQSTKQEVMRNIKMLCADQLYSIKNYDTDIFLIETEYKQLENISLRLHIKVKDDHIELRGFAYNGLSLGAYSHGISIRTTPAEFRAEYRRGKLTVMAQGYDEMIRLALAYEKAFGGSIDSYLEEL